MWQQWIGKPHVTGADPCVDEGCDCLLMVSRLRTHLGLAAPCDAMIQELIGYAVSGDYSQIHQRIAPHLQEVETRFDGAFTVYEAPDHIGTAVSIDGGVLHISPRRGVRWLPPNILKNLTWYDWR